MKRLKSLLEERVRHRMNGATGASSLATLDIDRARLQHELHVHQIEVEAQNRELQAAQRQLEVSRDRYADLYDFAPVGYVTLDQRGVIQDLNLTLAEMLGITRSQVVGKPFRVHVAKADALAFEGHVRQLKRPNDRATTELSLRSRHQGLVPVVLQSMTSADPESPRLLLRSAVTDISARKKVEQALLQNEARLAAILNHVAEPIFSINPRGVIESANQAAETMFGYQKGELIGHNLRLLLPDSQTPVFDAYLARLRATAHGQLIGMPIELQGVSRARRTFPIHLSVSDVQLAGRHIYTVLVRDISEERRQEEERRIQFDVMRQLAGSTKMHEVMPDLLALLTNGLGAVAGEFWQFLPSGQELRRIHAWPHPEEPSGDLSGMEAPMGQGQLDGIPGLNPKSRGPIWIADLAQVKLPPCLKAARQAGLRSMFGFPITSPHQLLGVILFFTSTPKAPSPSQLQLLSQIGSSVSAFVERAVSEMNLRRSEASLAIAQSIAMLGSFEIDLVDGNHTWSQEARRIIGITTDQERLVLAEPLHRLIHPDDQVRVRDVIDRAIHEAANLDVEYRIIQQGGAIRHVHVLAKPFRDASGRATHMVGTLHDITERRVLEREILQISDNERRSLGHDLHDGLGQQLTAMELQCQTLLTRLRTQAPQFVTPFEDVCRQLSDTVRQTRALAHGLSPIPLSDEGLSHALGELQETLGSRAGIRCHLRIDPDVRVPDPTVAIHLYRIAQEAVNNALRHGRARTINISLSREDNRLTLKVNNDGRRISRPRRDGSGMGLRIMQYRAGIIGATLRIACEPNDGTTISCTLHQRP